MNIADLVQNLIAESQEAQAAKRVRSPKAKKPRTSKLQDSLQELDEAFTVLEGSTTPVALVLVMETVTCSTCGNTATSWTPWVFLESHSSNKRVCRTRTRISATAVTAGPYKNLPKRIDHRESTAHVCPLCFHDIYPPTGEYQHQLPLEETAE